MANKNLYKGNLTLIIMKLLQENGRMYGYEITQKVKEMTNEGLVITEGALYPSLHKMEEEGWITSEMQRHEGRWRKYYRLTPQGCEAKETKMEEWFVYLKNMQLLLKT